MLHFAIHAVCSFLLHNVCSPHVDTYLTFNVFSVAQNVVHLLHALGRTVSVYLKNPALLAGRPDIIS